MSGFRPPPPGSAPPGIGSPDMSDALQDMMADPQAQSAQGDSTSGSTHPLSSAPQGKPPTPPPPPRPIGSPVEEAKYLAQDIGQSFLDLLPSPLRNILGPAPSDTPEDKMRKQQMFQNYQKMNADQQKVVQEKIQHEAMVKQKEQEEAARRRQLAAQQQQPAQVPQGKVRGDAGMGGKKSSKSQTINKLQDDRKKLKDSAM